MNVFGPKQGQFGGKARWFEDNAVLVLSEKWNRFGQVTINSKHWLLIYFAKIMYAKVLRT
jgi:hypothetical protein